MRVAGAAEDEVAALFARLPSLIDPAKATGLNRSYRFEIEGAGTWTLVVRDAVVAAREGGDDRADCTIFASAETFVQIAKGEQNPVLAFAAGRLRVAGDMDAAMRLPSLF